MWDQIGQLQFDFLVGQGLKPTDTLLDVGCGSLRGGVNFARFLEVGHYYGIDRSAALLDAGKEELRSRRLLDRRPTLVAMDDFGFDRLGVTFDYAIAISVFTHLPLNDIWLCLVQMQHALKPGGQFYATFFEGPAMTRSTAPVVHGEITTYPHRDPFHYDANTIFWLCRNTALRPSRIGNWNHPRNQKMLAFIRDR